MPVIVNEDEAGVQYMCDVCGVEIQNQTEGAYCPACGRIFCLDCSAVHPIAKVRVREDGPDYKKDEYMCDLCLREWRENIRLR